MILNNNIVVAHSALVLQKDQFSNGSHQKRSYEQVNLQIHYILREGGLECKNGPVITPTQSCILNKKLYKIDILIYE